MRLLPALAVLLLASPPAVDQPLPQTPAAVATALASTDASLRAAVDGWTKSGPPPRDVVLFALYQQRLYRLLARDTVVARGALPLLPASLRATSSDLIDAQRELYRLTPPLPANARVRVGAALPAARLVAYYRTAERRFGVPWNVLAAVNFVESKFDKLRNASAAGAQGPMQFMPATWARYGLGGDVHDAHDAILGAANYLRSSGAPGRMRRALHAYNPSPAYVDAVLRYARRMPELFYELYNWQVFLKTPHGERRVTGPR
jgi:membrane-bound lytic murein transglycosylase B